MAEKPADRPAPPGGGTGQTTSLSLLERARANDGDAWARVVALYEPLVRLWCRRLGLGPEDAEDVGQEVLASAAAHLGTFRRDRPGDSFRGWLRVIARNAAATHRRRGGAQAHGAGGSSASQRLQEVADPLAGAPEEESAEVDGLYRRAVEQVRCEFEERTWWMFWLTAVEGRPTAAVAAELGLSAGAVRQARSRVLRRLKQEVGELLD
jgi:RNA polymerase sigma-70 factor (ECF subfamily)